jgi:dihydrodipicolinate synthase/N-acetylneuraminate lyase
MFDRSRCRGVIVPLATPLDDAENVDVSVLKRLVDFLIVQQVDAIFPLGTTGEFARLEERQKWIALEACLQAVNGRAPVYAGVSDTGTKRVLANIRQASQLGADLAVCTLPYYFPVREEAEQLLFFRQVIENSPLPVLIYNIPATIGHVICLDVVAALAETDSIVGIKDSGGDLAYLTRLAEIKRQTGMVLVAGAEKIGQDALWLGADGLVPSLANVFPQLFVNLYHAALAGDLPRAQRLQAKIDEINRFNTITGSWLDLVTFRKKAMSLLGLGSGRLAEPYLKLDAVASAEIAALVEEMKTWR